MNSFYPKLTNTTVLIRDEARYSVVMRAIDILSEILSSGEYCSLNIKPNFVSETSMTVEFVTDKIVSTTDAFTTSLAIACDISLTTRPDGYMVLTLLFDGLYHKAQRVC